MTTNVMSSFEAYYAELLVVARARLAGERSPISTQTLAHELFLSLRNRPDLDFGSMEQFLGYASRAMRSLLVDMARQRVALKRHAELLPLTLGQDVVAGGAASPLQLLALNQAMERLGRADPRLLQVAELRGLLGMDFIEIADLLNLSEPTIKRDWQRAKAFLSETLGSAH